LFVLSQLKISQSKYQVEQTILLSEAPFWVLIKTTKDNSLECQ